MNPYVNRWLIFYPGRLVRRENLLLELRRFRRAQWWSRADIERHQLARVQQLVADAYARFPFYRERFDRAGVHPDDIKSLSDVARLPWMSRADLGTLAVQVPFTQRFFSTLKVTGGSTAEPAVVYKNRTATCREDAAMWLGLSWWGISPGDRQGRFWGTPRKSSARWKMALIDFVMNRKRASAMNFDDERLVEYFHLLRKFRPSYFYGYPSMLIKFTESLLRKGIQPARFGLKAIVTTAEPIQPGQIRFLEEQYRCHHVNDYGSSELGPIAYLCPHGAMHITSQNLYAEVVDRSGAALPPDTTGELVITDLNNSAMPLIRYRTGDFTSIRDAACGCGRSAPILSEILGRELNLLQATDGTYVHGGYIFYIIEEMLAKGHGRLQVQVVQDGRDHLDVFAVNDPPDQTRIAMFVDQLRLRLGQEMRIDVHSVPELQRERSGKLFITKNIVDKNATAAQAGEALQSLR
jgi:phenylacetate-CoA ligase